MIPEPPEHDPASPVPVERLVELLEPTIGPSAEPSPRDQGEAERRERIRHYARAPRRP